MAFAHDENQLKGAMSCAAGLMTSESRAKASLGTMERTSIASQSASSKTLCHGPSSASALPSLGCHSSSARPSLNRRGWYSGLSCVPSHGSHGWSQEWMGTVSCRGSHESTARCRAGMTRWARMYSRVGAGRAGSQASSHRSRGSGSRGCQMLVMEERRCGSTVSARRQQYGSSSAAASAKTASFTRSLSKTRRHLRMSAAPRSGSANGFKPPSLTFISGST
mmetsp:Transcript_33140/g.93820  ORF Transcript_33140/g.93820 Transcript_33140/m.93820 type:complete len:222 (-) Transcript_33140:1593-2258(-)